MRKVILFIANSLDGFVARPDGGFDWLFTDGDYGMRDFFKSVDTALVGRKTYDLMAGQKSTNTGMKGYVFSRSPQKSKDKHVEFVSGDIRNFILALKEQPGKDIWLVGGGELMASFLQKRLIDEFILTVHPIILGAGIPLFRGESQQIDLQLLACQTYESGIVQLRYGLK